MGRLGWTYLGLVFVCVSALEVFEDGFDLSWGAA